MPPKTLFKSREILTRAELFDRLKPEVSPAHFRKLKSLVGRALDAAGYTEGSPADLRIALTNLERRPSTKAVHSDAVGACRSVRGKAMGGSGAKRIAPSRDFALLPFPWRELLEYAATDTNKRIRNRLLALVRALEYLGCLAESPAAMPSSAELKSAGMAVGMGGHTMRTATSAYRRLRKIAIKANASNEPTYAPIPDGRRVRGRSTAALLFLEGESQDVLEAMKATEKLAPKFAPQLESYQKSPTVNGKLHKRTTVGQIVASAHRLVGALALHDRKALETFTIKDLWVQTRTLDAELRKEEEWDEVLTTPTDAPLARWVLEKITPGIREQCAPDAVSGYPSVILSDLQHWFSLTEWAHGIKLRGGAAGRWEQWRTHYRLTKQHVRENPIPPELLIRAKDKDTIVNTWTMSHVWCVGLPVLMREAERLLDRLQREITAAKKARPNADPLAVEAVQAALEAFRERAEPTIYTALVFYDGMRAAQYCGGTWGDHIRPDIDPETGEWLSVQTRWVGHRLDSARVKQGKPRARALGPALLSMRVVKAYIEYVRAPRLIAKGVEPSLVCELDGKYPLFVSTANGPPGPFSGEHLRRQFLGRTIYRMATEWFEKSFGSATCYEDIDREEMFGAFGVHMARYVNATGCYRIIDNKEFARELTSDDAKTLEKHYVNRSWLAEGRLGTWRNAMSHRPWLERMVRDELEGNPLDSMPSELLPPGVRQLFEQWEAEERALERNTKRSTYGSPSGRVRKARPDVAERNRQRAAERRARAEQAEVKAA